MSQLRRFFYLFQTLKLFSLCLSLLLIVACTLILLGLIYSQSDVFAELGWVFSSIWLASILVFTAFSVLHLRTWNWKLSRFVYGVEASQRGLKNALSAFYFGPSSPAFKPDLEAEAAQALQNIKLWPRLKPEAQKIALQGITLVLLFNLPHLQGPFSRLPLALSDLFQLNKEAQIILNPLQKAYLKNQPILLEGQITQEPLFPLKLSVQEGDAPAQILEAESLGLRADQNYAFRFQIEGLAHKARIQIYSSRAKSAVMTLKIVDFVSVTEQKFLVTPPAWLNQPDQDYLFLPPTLLKGSHLKHKIYFNKPLSRIALHPESMPVQVSSCTQSKSSTCYLLEAKIENSLDYILEFEDEDGFKDKTQRFLVQAIADTPPMIVIQKPGPLTHIEPGVVEKFEFVAEMRDDHRLLNLRLKGQILQRFEMTYLSRPLEYEFQPESTPVSFLNTSLPLEGVFLQEGDKLMWHLEGVDAFPGRQPTFSTTQVLYVPYKFEAQEKLEAEATEHTEGLKEVLAEQKSIESDVAELAQSLKNEKTEKPTQKQLEDLQEIQQKKANLQEKAEELHKQVDELLKEERTKAEPVLDEGSLLKMEKIRDLYQEVAQDMKFSLNAMQEMSKDLKNMDPGKMQEMMQHFDQKKFSEELDRALHQLEQFKLKQNLSKNLLKMQELESQHSKLRDSLDLDKEIASSEMENMQKQWDEVQKELEEALKNPHLSEPMKKALQEQLNENGLKKEDYQELKQDIQDKKTEARQKNRQIEKKLNQMRMAIQKEMNANQQKAMRVDLKKLDGFLREGHLFSRDLGQNLHLIEKTDAFMVKGEIARALSLLLAASKSRREEMKAEYQENLDFQGAILALADQMQQILHTGTKEYESDIPPQDGNLMQDAYRLNAQVYALLLQLKEKLMEQSQNEEDGGMQQELDSLAKQQNKLNQKTSRLSSSPRSQGNQQMMEQLAFQQSLVRKSTEQLVERYRKKAELAGSLNQIGEEMAEVEKRLQAGDASEATRQKQKQIEYKLLEANNAMKQQKESKKREAEVLTQTPQAQEGLSQNLAADQAQKALLQAIKRPEFPQEFLPFIQKFVEKIR